MAPDGFPFSVRVPISVDDSTRRLRIAAGVLGKALNAYAAAGIRSDHEAITVEEGRERLRAGMWLLIREASGARNLEALKQHAPALVGLYVAMARAALDLLEASGRPVPERERVEDVLNAWT